MTQAKKQSMDGSVKCDRCGKTIAADPRVGIATDYVWRDGEIVCNECNRKRGEK